MGKNKIVDENQQPNRKKRILRIFAALILGLILLALIAIAAGAAYWRYMLGLVGDASQSVDTTPVFSTESAVTETSAEPSRETEITSPEETWPQITSDENITNIMLIGQNYREGENHKLSDTMILCSINREKNTLSMVSILRDLYVPLPAYAGHGPGRNRINVCYHLGSLWTGKPEGGMEMLAMCVEQNFGIPVDHSIEVNFDAFTQIIDVLGGVEIDLTKAEANYLTKKVGYVGEFEPGLQILNGMEALAYARIRKIDGDIQRTGRQRTVISSILEKCRGIGLMELHKLATAVLPMITTDMTGKEITDYIWEFLPMLKKLEIQTLTCPVSNDILRGSYWSKEVEMGGIPAYVLECNLALNRGYLTEYLGLNQKEAKPS